MWNVDCFNAAVRFLLPLLICGICPASTLTVNLDVRENLAPSRHANLSISDGLNGLSLDLYRTSEFPGYLVPNDLYPVFSATVPVGSGPTPFLNLDGVRVPDSDIGDYQVSFAFTYLGSSTADLSVEVIQLSTGLCVFCARAPNATEGVRFLSAEGPYDYHFTYAASGEIIPEPRTWQLILLGIGAMATTRRTWMRHALRH